MKRLVSRNVRSLDVQGRPIGKMIGPEKSMHVSELAVRTDKLSLFAMSDEGRGEPSQDRFFVGYSEETGKMLVGALDGLGTYGDLIAERLCEGFMARLEPILELGKLNEQIIKLAASIGFMTIGDEMEAIDEELRRITLPFKQGGTTLTMALIDPDGTYIALTIGDSSGYQRSKEGVFTRLFEPMLRCMENREWVTKTVAELSGEIDIYKFILNNSGTDAIIPLPRHSNHQESVLAALWTHDIQYATGKLSIGETLLLVTDGISDVLRMITGPHHEYPEIEILIRLDDLHDLQDITRDLVRLYDLDDLREVTRNIDSPENLVRKIDQTIIKRNDEIKRLERETDLPAEICIKKPVGDGTFIWIEEKIDDRTVLAVQRTE